MLTEWVDPTRKGGKPEMFWRSATSGAKATQDYKAGRNPTMGGDLVAVDPAGQFFIDLFSVECKDRAEYGRLEAMLEGRGKLAEWWEQCCNDAGRTDPPRIPLLIFKRKGSPLYLAHRVGDFELFDSCADLQWEDGDCRRVRMVLFEVWLHTVKAEQVQRLADMYIHED